MREHRQLTEERAEAEGRANEVHRLLVEPLRAMRMYDYLTEAVQREIKRQATDGGGQR